MQHAVVRPAFEVHKLRGKVRREIVQVLREPDVIDPKTKIVLQRGKYIGMERTTHLEDAGYMVYFPQGHSLRMSHEELVRNGFHNTADMVDMETGERIVPDRPMTLKDMVEGRTRRRVAIDLNELLDDNNTSGDAGLGDNNTTDEE